jgi:uncharacterized membrane protein YraQ (UPF0718 family)/copper chaperone CopZ
MTILLDFLQSVWSTTQEMAPYLLFGFILAGILSQLVTPETVERHLGKPSLWTTIKASLLGVPLPLCSCGVIPVAASLRRHGASRGATTAFLISTPQTGVDSIAATYGMLGPVVAIFRVVAAFVSGLFGGVLVDKFGGKEPENGFQAANGDHAEEDGKRSLKAGLRYGFLTLPASIGNALIVGLLIAGALSALIPNEAIPAWLGKGIVGMLAMMALGVPMYVCATASIPVAAAMVAKGVSPGAALVFLMTGPATNAATVGVLWRTMGRRAAALYVAVVAVSALASGMLLNALFAGGGLSGEHIHNMQMLPTWLKTVAAIVLLALIVLPRFLTKHASHDSCELGDDERGLDLEVSGMTCQHCAESARKAGMACSGVRDVQVDLKGGKVHVAGTAPDIDELQKALAGVGFQAKLAKSR